MSLRDKIRGTFGSRVEVNESKETDQSNRISLRNRSGVFREDLRAINKLEEKIETLENSVDDMKENQDDLMDRIDQLVDEVNES